MKFFRTAGLLVLLADASPAQNPPAAADLIRNGGFESTLQAPNLWTGVDKDGFLAGFRGYLPVLNESGGVADTAMPLAVAVGDLNADGLPDLMTSDPLGYARSYLNSGSKEQPKFTTGLITTPFLNVGDGSIAGKLPGLESNEDWTAAFSRASLWSRRRMGMRLSLAPLGEGRTGLLAGNYFGEIFFVPQTGAGGQTIFPQPDPLNKALLPLSPSAEKQWAGNMLSPLLRDWDGDGKPDLIVGEGSYSANNVHFFPNEGSASTPVFKAENRRVLALGEGREQLTPAVVDLNGDGKDDLLVSDRLGRVTAYLRPANWKKEEPMKPSGQLSKTGGLTTDDNQSLVLGTGIHTIATGDLNGDGLFDLVAGTPGGRIVWAPNKGTKEQPKFETPTDLAGDKPSPATWLLPSQWEMDTGEARGNVFAYASCVSAQEDPAVEAKQGTRALKFGFAGATGSPLANWSNPGDKSFRFGNYEQRSFFYDLSLANRLLGAPSRTIMMQQTLQLETGKPYILSFQYKGSGVARANIFLGWWGFKVLGENTITRGARGSAKVQYNHANEHDKISKDFKPSASWTTFSEKFTVNFKNRDLKDEKTTHKAVLIIALELSSPDGTLYLDDLKLARDAS